MKPCNCISEIDARLIEKNLKLTLEEWSVLFRQEGTCPIVPGFETRWIDESKAPKGKKKHPPAMLGSHCPFCGIPFNESPG